MLNRDGTVTIDQSTIASNTGDGVVNVAYDGSAILTVIQSTISGNSGRGVHSRSSYDSVADVTIIQSMISDNGGGGVLNSACNNWYCGSSATVALAHSTISSNTSSYGGGVLNVVGSVTLTQSTISGNTATNRGGGVLNSFGSLTLTHSTISGNTATDGGGVVNAATDALSNATLTFALTSSLVAGNLAPTAPEVLQSGGTLTANAFNLFGISGTAGVTGFTPGPTDLVPSEPLTAILDPVLADHGGPTLTHALVPGSPAIDEIPWGANGCGTTIISDQRERARPQPAGGRCDIGAYEVGVAGQPLGGWVTGFTPHTVTCENVTTGHEVTLSEPATSWDCEAVGLGVTSGDQVAMRVRGPVNQDATDIGGAVVGMMPSSGGCTNLTTGQQVSFQHMVGATAGSCVVAGLVVHSGDRVQMHVQGVAE